MGRLRVLSGREAGRILQQHGFVEVRRRGSHIVMQLRTDSGSVTVPIPDHRELTIGTLLSIIRQRAGYSARSSRSDLKRVSVAWNFRVLPVT
ncbi:MAG: type II toxin-antitoxin system HicA family toxin [Candidatus Rokuibacteriota bacterium]